MALGTTDLLVEEQRLAAPGGRTELAADQMWTGHRLHRLQVLVNRHRLLLGTDGEQDVGDPGANRVLGIGANARGHRRRRLVRQQHAPDVFGVPQPVVHQVPVQGVHPGVGMTARTTLPVLEAEAGVVEEHLAAALYGQLRPWTQRDRREHLAGLGFQVDHGKSVGEVAGDVGVRADNGQSARAAVLHFFKRRRCVKMAAVKPDSPPDPHQERQIVGHVGGRGRSIDPAVVRAAAFFVVLGGGHGGQLLQQGLRVDHAQLVRAGVADTDQLPVRRGRHAPRIGRAKVHVVQEHGVDQLLFHRVDDRHRVGVHPAALELRGGHLVPGKNVNGVNVLAVR